LGRQRDRIIGTTEQKCKKIGLDVGMEMVFSIYCSARIYWQALSLLGQRHSFGSVSSMPVRAVEEDLKLLNFSLTMAWRKAIN